MAQLPIDALPAWAHLNDVRFTGVEFRDVGDGKGFGLLAESDISGPIASSNDTAEAVLEISQDLVLSDEAVDDYAKVDQNFRQLLEAAGRQVRTHLTHMNANRH